MFRRSLMITLAIAAMAFAATTPETHAQPPPAVEIRVQSGFGLEALRVWINGYPAREIVSPMGMRSFLVPNGSNIVVKPDISEGVPFIAGPGRWVVEPDGFFTLKTKITQVE